MKQVHKENINQRVLISFSLLILIHLLFGLYLICFFHSIPISLSILLLIISALISLCIIILTLKYITRAEREIQNSRQLLSNAMDFAPIGMMLVEPSGKFHKVNQAFSEITGYSDAELQEMNYQDITHPEDYAIGPEVVQDLISGKIKKASFEKRYIKKDGTVIDVFLTTSLLKNRDDKPLYLFTQLQDVTHRKQTEKRLVRFSRIFEDSLNEIYLFDAKTLKFKQANKAALQNLGYTLKELKEMTALDIKPNYTLDIFKLLIAPLRKGEKKEIVFETIHKRKDETCYDVEVHLQLITHERDALFAAIILDITDRKRSEADILKIHRSIKRQNITFSAINRLFRESMQCDSSSEVAKVCLSVAEDVTRSRYGAIAEVNSTQRFDTLALSHMAEMNPENNQNKAIWKAALESSDGIIINNPSSHPLSAGLPKGHSSLTSFLGMPFQHKNFKGILGLASREGGYKKTDKEIIQALVLAFAEVINSKRAEEALRKSEEKYRKLIELAQEGIWVIDKNNITTFVNPSMAKMLGYTSDEMKGKNIFTFMNQEVADRAKLNLKNRHEGKREPFDFEFIRKDGHHILTTLETATIRDKESHYNGAIIGVIDITERKRSEMARERLQTQLIQAQKLESIGNLAGGIAHDFNNILSSIIGFTELVLDDVENGTLVEENLQEVYTAGKRAKDLVKQILTFARRSEEKVKPIQVNLIITEVLKLIRSTIPTTIEINQVLKSDALILGNPTQVHQIMMNLCSNAAYSMEENGGTLSVTLKEVKIDNSEPWKNMDLKKGPYIEIKVSDTGVGIAPAIIDSIFEPYFTIKPPGEGTGMGLAVVHGIVETYGGKVQVESKVNHGTTFTIYLPVSKKLKDHAPYQSKPLPKGEEHILLVDDESAITRMGQQILERLGYTVTPMTNSTKALDIFSANPMAFDLIISDMTMPILTGDKLAAALMKIRPDIPVILCTGYSKKISEKSATDIGIKAFVYKPLVKTDFAKTVRRVLDAAAS